MVVGARGWELTSSSECQHSSNVFRTCTEHISAVAAGGTPPTGGKTLSKVCHPDASRGRIVVSPRTLLSTPTPRLEACDPPPGAVIGTWSESPRSHGGKRTHSEGERRSWCEPAATASC